MLEKEVEEEELAVQPRELVEVWQGMLEGRVLDQMVSETMEVAWGVSFQSGEVALAFLRARAASVLMQLMKA